VNGIFPSQIGPTQWKLTLAAFLVEKADPLFTAVFFACQSFELMARERMKGMRDPKLLRVCTMNVCSLTPTSQDQITRDLEAAFQAMGYAYVIARLSSVDAVPETERQGAIAELREMGQVRGLTPAETVANI